MRLILEPRGGYRPNSQQPSRPTIPQRPKRPLVLKVTSDDGHFDRLKNREPPQSPRPIQISEPKSTMTIFSRRMRKKGSLVAELAKESVDDDQKKITDSDDGDGDDGGILLPLEDDNFEAYLIQDSQYDDDDPSMVLSPPSDFSTTDTTPTTPPLWSNPIPTEAPSALPTGRIAKMMSAINIESSRLEISLLALGILILVAQMGALIWIGVRRRRRSAQWHRKERQQVQSEDTDHDQDVTANRSRFSSTAGLLLRSPFLASSSGGQGLDAAGMMPAFFKRSQTAGQGITSSWERFKARFGRRGGTPTGATGDEAANGAGANKCLFDEVFPPPNSGGCSIRNAFEVEGSISSYFGPEVENNPLGGGATGPHHHDLVLGPPTVIPVSIPPVPKSTTSSPSTGSLSTTASEFIDTVRRKSSAILAETIMPPVQVQMEVLTEIGRRVSATLQSSVGSVISRGPRERRGTGNENDHNPDDKPNGRYGYSRSKYHGYSSTTSGDDELSSSSNEGSVSLTPPEERYRKDLEAGGIPSPILRSRGGEDAAVTSGAAGRFSFNGFIPEGGSPGGSLSGSAGLVRRTNVHYGHKHRPQHKRVSFADGLVSQSSSSTGESRGRSRGGGGRRHSSFVFLQRGSGASRRPGDEEMGGQFHEGQREDEEDEVMSYAERDSEQRVFHLV